MKTEGSLGIWMDHSNAHLTEFTTDPMKTSIITSGFTHDDKARALNKSEKLGNNMEQHGQLKFYNEIGNAIRNYEEVILFGPTDAKSELLNHLKADHNFENVKITIKQADKMTENQQHAFVKEHFSRH